VLSTLRTSHAQQCTSYVFTDVEILSVRSNRQLRGAQARSKVVWETRTLMCSTYRDSQIRETDIENH
jgi:hypothetical protein